MKHGRNYVVLLKGGHSVGYDLNTGVDVFSFLLPRMIHSASTGLLVPSKIVLNSTMEEYTKDRT